MPSTVGTCTGNPFTSGGLQTRLFWDGSYWFVFYRTNNDFVYRTSSDGLNWSDTTTVWVSFKTGGQCVAFFPPNSVHVIKRAADNKIQIKKGTISGASISWGSVYDVFSASCGGCVIRMDDSGYIWVITGRFGGEPLGPIVKRSTNPDDPSLWEAESKIGPDESRSAVKIVTLGTNKAIGFFLDEWAPNYELYCNYFNGTSWGGYKFIAYGSYGGYYDAEITSDGRLHIVYRKPDGKLGYKYSDSPYSSFSDEVIVDSNTDCHHPVLVCQANTVYLFYLRTGTSTLWRRELVSGESWSSAVQFVSETNLTAVTSSLEVESNGEIGVAWRRGSASPFDVRFETYEVSPEEEELNPLICKPLICPTVISKPSIR